MRRLKKIPVVVHLNPKAVYSADLDAEVAIPRHSLDRALRNQAAKYAWWSSLLTEVTAKVWEIEEAREILEAELYIKYERLGYSKQYEIKNKIKLDVRFQKISSRLRRWKKAEMQLRSAEKAFSQRKDMLQTLSANTRKEKDSEPKYRR